MNMKALLAVAAVLVAVLVGVAAWRVATVSPEPTPAPIAVEATAPTPTPALKGALRRDNWEAEKEDVTATTLTVEEEFDQADQILDSREASLEEAKGRVRVVIDAVKKER